MIIRFKTVFVTVVFSLLLLVERIFAQQDDEPLVFTLGPLASDTSITCLSTIFDGKITDEVRWVGFGEFTHGGEETALFKSGMIRYLIPNRQHRQLLVESPDVILHTWTTC